MQRHQKEGRAMAVPEVEKARIREPVLSELQRWNAVGRRQGAPIRETKA